MAEGTVLLRRRALGDLVLLGAVTAAVGGPVTVCTEPRYLGLAARLSGVDRVLPWAERRSARGRVVDLQGLRWPRRHRIRKRSVRRRLGLWLGRPYLRPSVPDLYAEACGVVAAPPPWLELPLRPRDALALVAGASSPLKRWSARGLAEVGARWAGPVVVLGGPGEEALVGEVAGAVPGALTLVEEGFERTVDALGRTSVAVGGDSGLLHLAAACGAATVALFGPTHPADGFTPWGGVALQRELACRPCALHRVSRCRQRHHGCMAHSVDAVWAAVQAAAEGTPCAGSS